MRALRRVLLVLLLLIGLAVAGVLITDGMLRSSTERSVADNLRASVPFDDTPQVSIGGYPFLLGAALGFPEVHVAASGMPLDTGDVKLALTNPDFTLTGVHGSASGISAESLTGSAILPYGQIDRLSGGTTGFAGAGRVGYVTKVEIAGAAIDITISGMPSLDAAQQTITIGEPKASVGGVDIPQAVVEAAASQLVKPIAVPLPFGLRVESVVATSVGLKLAVTGTNVTFPP